MDIKRHQLLASIAEMYYKQNYSQEEIARKTGYSRSNISRLLKEGIETEVVSISIKSPFQYDKELENQLKSMFNLKVIRVIDNYGMNEEDTKNEVAKVAANKFESLIKPNDIVGISWGSMLYRVTKYLSTNQIPHATIVQIGGSADASNSRIDGSEILYQFSQKLGLVSINLPAPLLADDTESAQVLLNQSSVRNALEIASKSSVAVLGIGSMKEKSKSKYRGRFSKRDIDELSKLGVVGDICGFHYSIDGKISDIDMNHRIIALDPVHWSKIPYTIGVTAGVSKAESVLGALNGELINGLIIDAELAKEVIRIYTSR